MHIRFIRKIVVALIVKSLISDANPLNIAFISCF